eukprot:CAMPEP_0201919580 /NCGR_PEP_ID=MMETSP0903-20130614/8421_1 /ASSEMBLY_ACC=CAM_ASM_000552 /TAXON_ID=420261 /ORGANISM="Thalassiosira antarctica, Strain CCMP982" /LENGTH=199 /DNA_ID=CAMNT_0048456127 /DNA_START=121 /DNA_END=717 /DNA_ORIENTATION=+
MSTSISGYAFFDYSNDGTRDIAIGSFDYGISGISVLLFTCTNELLKTTSTDSSGFYTFEELNGGGQYYIESNPPSWYIFSDVWKGKTDENGVLLYPDADSAVNPETGRSVCFELAEEKDVSFGMEFDITPNPTPIPTPIPTPNPTPIPTFRPISISSPPSKKPTMAPSTMAPTIRKTPTLSPAPSINLRYCGLGLEDAQ